MPSYVGLEYMAQACGAHAGVLARDAGAPVRIGFLLGTRQYQTDRPWFRFGDRLTVSVSMTYSDNEMASFSCRIEIAGATVADAQLNVIQPRSDHPMLQRGMGDA
jgi:predicted hotdog family 3-hydroxylacyl-ACP dehydratase